MSRNYAKAPILEAVCEFVFSQDSQWDIAVPGLMFERVKDRYPKRKQTRSISPGLARDSDALEFQVQTMERIQFLNDDEKTLLQVGPHLLSINRLRPYVSWNAFSPEIEFALSNYRAVAEPSGIHRIGLRFINRIEFTSSTIRLESFLNFRPFLGPGIPRAIGPFISGIQVPYRDGKDNLKLQVTSTEAVDEKAAVLLDIDYYLLEQEGVTLDEVGGWIQSAHSVIEQTFEACITDETRALFQEREA